MGVYENLLPGKKNALTPEYLTVKCHFSSVRMLQKQIEALQAKIRKEKQLNKQMEMNAELKKLRNLLTKMVR